MQLSTWRLFYGAIVTLLGRRVNGDEEFGNNLRGAIDKVLQHPIVEAFGLQKPFNLGETLELWIYTHDSPENATILTMKDSDDTFRNTSYIWLQESLFLIHGMQCTLQEEWLQKMKSTILKVYGFNVVLVDWSKMAAAFTVLQEEVNCIVVGKELADFLRRILNQTLAESRMFHLIGHSLGAHIAGVTGRELNGTIGRITGLDPSFLMVQRIENDLHMRSDDAIFVDVVTTNFKGVGTDKLVGQLNFITNGGEIQPFCKRTGALVMLGNFIKRVSDNSIGSTEEAICSHLIAHDYFIESAGVAPTRLLGYHCPDYNSFLNRTCNYCSKDYSNCSVFGFLAQKPNRTEVEIVRAYLNTSNDTPYFGV